MPYMMKRSGIRMSIMLVKSNFCAPSGSALRTLP
jgi:hypothetical protein